MFIVTSRLLCWQQVTQFSCSKLSWDGGFELNIVLGHKRRRFVSHTSRAAASATSQNAFEMYVRVRVVDVRRVQCKAAHGSPARGPSPTYNEFAQVNCILYSQTIAGWGIMNRRLDVLGYTFTCDM